MPLSVKLSIGFLICLIVCLIYLAPIVVGSLLVLALTAVTVFRTIHYFMEERE